MEIPMKLKSAMHYYFSRHQTHDIEAVGTFIRELRTSYPLNREYQRQLEYCQNQLEKYQTHTNSYAIAQPILMTWLSTGNLPKLPKTAMEISEEIGVCSAAEPTIETLLKENKELRKQIAELKEELAYAKSSRSAGRLHSKQN